MPTLDFKGKQHIYAHHLTVPYRPLVSDISRSVPSTPPPPYTSSKTISDDSLIIHGDNLHALKALLPRYAGRVKCIYIDPPYNTGNEGWVYNDRVNSPLMKAWLKENSQVDGEDLERHDKWLCMMWPRLHLLKELLSEDGVIFISIDDNEHHHLRMTMDEIFGVDNFVESIVWRKKAGGGQDRHYFAREHDSVLCYRKGPEYVMNFRTTDVSANEYKKVKNGRRCKFTPLEKWGSNSYRTDRPTMFYAIKDPDGNDFYPQAPDGKEGNWRSRPAALDSEHIHWERNKRKEGRWRPFEVTYYDELKSKERIIKERSIFYDLATTTDAANEQKQIFGSKVMDNSKPVDLIYRILDISTGPDDIILDSFSGSGTTAHATLALNKEDGGKRKFILVECEDYADTITAERVRRVINGVPNARDKSLREGLDGSFTYCALGEPIDAEMMLNGEALPSYSSLAAYLLYTATGVSAGESELNPQNEDGLFYSDDKTDYYMLYKPDIEYLCGNDPILNAERAKGISATSRERDRKAVMFAPAKYMGQRDLTNMGITFCQLPYELYRAR